MKISSHQKKAERFYCNAEQDDFTAMLSASLSDETAFY
jgi:hypothetical protein